MSRRFWLVFAVMCSSFASLAQPALAQQTFNVSLGYFTLGAGCTCDRRRPQRQSELPRINVKDFNGASNRRRVALPGWPLHRGGRRRVVHTQDVPTVYSRLLNANGSEIEQELRLRMIPAALTFRVLPVGQDRGFQPYIGGASAHQLALQRIGPVRRYPRQQHFQQFVLGFRDQDGPVAMGGIRFAGIRSRRGSRCATRRPKPTRAAVRGRSSISALVVSIYFRSALWEVVGNSQCKMHKANTTWIDRRALFAFECRILH